MVNCPECKGNVIPQGYELVCSNCGLVIEDVGGPTPVPKGQLGSLIDGVGPEDWVGVKTLRQKHKDLHETIMNEAGSRLEKEVGEEIGRLSSHLNLPEHVLLNSKNIYSNYRQIKKRVGHTTKMVAAASIYSACRRARLPILSCEVRYAAADILREPEFMSTYKDICAVLKIRTLPVPSEAFVPKYANALHMRPETEKKAYEIIKKITWQEYIPNAVAGAALYTAGMITGDRRRQRDIADICYTTEVNISHIYHRIIEKLGMDLNENNSAAQE